MEKPLINVFIKDHSDHKGAVTKEDGTTFQLQVGKPVKIQVQTGVFKKESVDVVELKRVQITPL